MTEFKWVNFKDESPELGVSVLLKSFFSDIYFLGRRTPKQKGSWGSDNIFLNCEDGKEFESYIIFSHWAYIPEVGDEN